jgi:ATP-dependent DNA ligase
VLPPVTPQLLANGGLRTLHLAIADSGRYAVEGKIDGVRGVVTLDAGHLGVRNREGEPRQCLRGQRLEGALRRLATTLPILWHGAVLDGELIAYRFVGTMSGLYGSRRQGDPLRYLVFGVPVLASVDLRPLPWSQRRERLELLAAAFEPPARPSALVKPSTDVAQRMLDGEHEGLALKDRNAPYRHGSRAGWWKVKDRSWYEREALRVDWR